MKNLIIVGVFIGVILYVMKKTSPPLATVPTNTGVVTAPLIFAPSIGPTDGGNSYPGMAGVTYAPVPGSPGLLMPVKATGFVGIQGTENT